MGLDFKYALSTEPEAEVAQALEKPLKRFRSRLYRSRDTRLKPGVNGGRSLCTDCADGGTRGGNLRGVDTDLEITNYVALLGQILETELAGYV